MEHHSNVPAPAPLHTEPVGTRHRAALLRLRVRPEQRGYVGAVADLLADAAACPASTSLAILCGEEVIGHARIEANARSVAGYEPEQPTLGLRAFFIDARCQGQGLGTRALAALLDELAARHPHAGGVMLAVDTGNTAALALYRRAGFTDARGRYDGAPSPPQRLLWRALPRTSDPCTTTSVTSST
jgi:GNAT superfamily N-acetyltransferase